MATTITIPSSSSSSSHSQQLGHDFHAAIDHQQQPEEEEEDDDDEFFETLDHIPSSSGSDDDGAATPSHRRPSPYELWLSAPSSVQERRGRLLRQLGLTFDPRDIFSSPGAAPGGDPDAPTASGADGNPPAEEDPAVSRELQRGKPAAGSPEAPAPRRRRPAWLSRLKQMAGAMVHGKNGRKTGRAAGGGGEADSHGDGDEDSCHGSECRPSSASAVDAGGAELPAFLGGLERVRVRQRGSAWRELTGMFVIQEVGAHAGAVWTLRFSPDGKYLASAGEDCVIQVWEAMEAEPLLPANLSNRSTRRAVRAGADHADITVSEDIDDKDQGGSPMVGKAEFSKSGRYWRRRSASFTLENLVVPEKVFALSEQPVRSFHGHERDVLDLSWSRSEVVIVAFLLSSSMDTTVKMWAMKDNSCLRTFSHNDYVTSIEFNPSDETSFISGCLDSKIRIWSIPKREVVHWSDMHDMVTAVCYTPDGQGAFAGSNKGTCHFYSISDNKMHLKGEINLDGKKKKSSHKKITGFQFAPGGSSEVFVTSADSRIRVVDDLKVVHKFKGFRNKTSQIAASLTADGEHVVCASEDSQVYVWRYDRPSEASRALGDLTVTQSYEHFHCKHVTVAAAWPRKSTGPMSSNVAPRSSSTCTSKRDETGQSSPVSGGGAGSNSSHHNPRPRSPPSGSATWPEEKLSGSLRRSSGAEIPAHLQGRSAWGMVIVAAGRGGEIKVFQNFGYPAHT